MNLHIILLLVLLVRNACHTSAQDSASFSPLPNNLKAPFVFSRKADQSVDGFFEVFKMLQENCGPQERKVCIDSVGTIFCYHLSQCSGYYMYSSSCLECLGSTWCGPSESQSNTTGICTNNPSYCEMFDPSVPSRTNFVCPSQNEAPLLDCNFNGIQDSMELEIYPYLDSNGNGIIDDCEVDCNGNSIYDFLDITSGSSRDLNDNHIPDECDPDCNNNGAPDELDIMYKVSKDFNLNSIPDECEAPSHSPSPSVSHSISPSPSVTVTTSPTPSVSPSSQPSPTSYTDPSQSTTPSIQPPASVTPTTSVTPSEQPSPSTTPSNYPTLSPSYDPNHINFCDTNNCTNGGYCDRDLEICSCIDGWIGRHCEISDCNYKGIFNIYNQMCTCYPGWSGIRCESCATSMESHPERVYLCCPSFGESQGYNLVLVPESKKDDYLNGLYTPSRCVYQNTSFPNRDSLDCSCRYTEGENRLTEEQMELRQQLHGFVNKVMKPKFGNIIQDYKAMDADTYNMAAIFVIQQIMTEELQERYPIQLANALSESRVSFAETSSDETETVGIIIFSVVVIIVVLVAISLFIFIVMSSRTKVVAKKSPKKKRRKDSV